MNSIVPKKTYFVVWVVLLVFLLLTWGTAYLPLGPGNLIINLGIAVAKALFVMFFFMHLRTSDALIQMVAFAALFWLLILVALSLSDFLSR